jgi:predicted transcriptional regulator
MDLIEIAVLIAAKKNSRKTDIVREAMDITRLSTPVEGKDIVVADRQLRHTIDLQVKRGTIRNERLGEYEITTKGVAALANLEPLLRALANRISATI